MRRYAYDVRTCDACGYADRDVEPFMAGRSGIATLTAELCRRCMLRVEESILTAIKELEAAGASR
jgi:hypothetical protein